MNELKIEFLGFQSQHLLLDAASRAQLTSATNTTNIDIWHEYERSHPNLFYAMYNFYCQKNE